MIKAVFTKENNHYKEFEITGHANSAPHGKDLVCAAASAVVFGILNSLNDNDVDINVEDNLITIKNISTKENTQTIIRTLSTSLKTIEEQHSDHIKVKD